MTAAGPIEDFWKWWTAAGRAAAEAGIGSGSFTEFTDAASARVSAMDPDLQWELSEGQRAQHALVVTAGGVPELRRLAERWYQQAPPASTVWEYYPARQPSRSSLEATLELDGHKLRLSELSFDLHIDNDRQLINTVVFHPRFARMAEEARTQVAFLALDWALGEDGVTRWIGAVETASNRPAAAVPSDTLIEATQALAERASASRWALAHWEQDGAVVLATVATSVKWIDHPLMDLHLAVRVPFADQTPEGLPGPEALGQLRALEDALKDRLPPSALLVAHETTQGVRTLHLYADSDDPALVREVQAAISGWPGAAVTSRRDVGWQAVRHLIG